MKNNNEEKWKELIQQIKELAIKKHGKNFRLPIHLEYAINRNRLTRFFQIKNPPRISTFFLILDALGYELVIKKKRNKC